MLTLVLDKQYFVDPDNGSIVHRLSNRRNITTEELQQNVRDPEVRERLYALSNHYMTVARVKAKAEVPDAPQLSTPPQDGGNSS